MEELRASIAADMKKAMRYARVMAEGSTKAEVGSFYSVGSPVLYKRTGKLANSVRVKDGGGGTIPGFSIYMDQSYGYTVPNPVFTERGYASYFSTPMVLEASEAGTAHIKGKSGFWKRSEERIKKDLDLAFSLYFKEG